MLKKTWIGLLAGCAVAFAAETNLVKNGSFEELDARGVPKAWNMRIDGNEKAEDSVWISTTENVQDGERSIMYNNEPKKYRFVTQTVPAESGKFYRYSILAKVVPANADKECKAKPNIFFEFYADGKYMGGEYGSTIVDLNTDWVKVTGKATVPPGVKSVTLGFRVTPNGTGDAKVWFDKCELVEAVADVFTGGLATDHYRDQAAGGKVTVYCGRGQGKTPFPEATFKASCLQVIAGDKVVLTAPADKVLSDRLVYAFDSDKLAVGKYTMRVVVTAPDGKVHTQDGTFTKLAAEPRYKTTIDTHRRMIVDGKPFFPLGMYMSSIVPKNMELYLDSKFNCVMPYTPPKDKALMDYLQEHNIRIFYSIKDSVSTRKHDAAATKELQAKGLARLKEWKDHPAVVAWYINDELPEEFAGDAIQYRQACEELDPDHPTWTVLCRPSEFRAFLNGSDILGGDPYPIPNGKPQQAYRWTRLMDDAVMGAKMVLMVPQAFCWGHYWVRYGYPIEKCRNCRRPSYEEMDAMSWMCIAGGANGLIYYSYTDLQRRDKEGVLPRIPMDEHFGELKKISERIMSHEQVLLSIEEPAKYTVASNTEKLVALRPYALNGTTWILAVNTSDEKPATVTLEFEKAMALEGLTLSEADVKVNGKQVNATLKPLETVFIKLK